MTPLGLIRPDSWDLPLFVHVLGAMTLVGSMFALLLLAAAARSGPRSGMFAQLAFRTDLMVVIPAWLVMRVGAEWIVGREYPGNASDPGWVGVGFIVSDAGLLVLILATVFAWRSAKKGGGGWATALAVLSALYLVALGAAMFAMSAKPS